MRVRPDNNINELHKSREDRRGRRSDNAQPRRPEFPEDQNIVSRQVHSHRQKRGDHGRDGLSVRPDRRAVGLCQRKGKKADTHHGQIVHSGLHCGCRRSSAAVFVKIEINERPSLLRKYGDPDRHKKHRCYDLQTEGPADAFVVLFSAILRGEYADSRQASEHAQVPHK